MENGVDPDETAHYDTSHLDLHCLPKYLVSSAGLKEFGWELIVRGRRNVMTGGG